MQWDWQAVWQTTAAILTAIVLIAAAIKAALFIADLIGENTRFGRWVSNWRQERRRRAAVLEQLTSDTGWPNGSKSLPESLNAIYGLMVSHLQDHKAAEIDQARGAREWDERDAASI